MHVITAISAIGTVTRLQVGCADMAQDMAEWLASKGFAVDHNPNGEPQARGPEENKRALDLAELYARDRFGIEGAH